MQLGLVTTDAPPRPGPALTAPGLAALLDEARRALDDDRDRARDCLDRALQLMRPSPAPRTGGQGALASWQAERVRTFISNHLYAPIRVRDVAAVVRLSAGHFGRRFRASFGENPVSYIARQRVELAKQVMTSTRQPLAVTALEVGFCDQAHLTRVFKRFTGVSPGTWIRHYEDGGAQRALRPAS